MLSFARYDCFAKTCCAGRCQKALHGGRWKVQKPPLQAEMPNRHKSSLRPLCYLFVGFAAEAIAGLSEIVQ